MDTPHLRPLDLGSLLETTGKVYLGRVATLMALAAVAALPIYAALTGFQLWFLSWAGIDDPTSPPTQPLPQPEPEQVVAGVAAGAAVAMLQFLLTLLVTGASVRVVGESYVGKPSSWTSGLQFAAGRLLPMLWLALIQAVLVLLASIFIIVPGIWLAVAWIFSVPALLTEDVRGIAALRRSFHLVKGRWWPTFGTLLLVWVLMAIVQAVVGAMYNSAAVVFADPASLGFMFAGVGGAIAAVVTTPFMAVLLTVLYLDLRARKEELNLPQLQDELGIPT